MARTLFYTFATGGLLGLVGLPLLPERASVVGTLGAACCALAVAAVVLVVFDRLPGWVVQGAVALGTLLISAGLYYNGQRADDAELLYLWAALFSFYFLSWRWATAQVGLIGLAFAAVLAAGDELAAGVTRWLFTMGTLILTGVLARLLKDRLASFIARLADAARTDPLTGVLNRRGFRERFDIELDRARRDSRPVSLLVGDLDCFKEINDRYGHQAGDHALQRVATVLDHGRRQVDTLARLGGEEFAVITPGADDMGAFMLAERLRSEVRNAFADDDFELGISFGIACCPALEGDAEVLLQAADDALYAAKAMGRDRTVIHSEQTAGLANRGSLSVIGEEPAPDGGLAADGLVAAGERAQIEQLLDSDDGIVPVFQPVVALATGHVAGYEALARFSPTPRRSPPEWFGQAERCGLGPELEAYAIRAALRSAADRPTGTYLSINASPSALSSGPIQDALPSDLSGLVIEITEQELVGDDHGVEADLSNLRMRGARIAVDDAGSAYAGLQQVMRMQPDIIKLDRSLIDSVSERVDKAALVEAFVRFAQRTGAAVCAEGIETLEDLEVLAALDVDYGQGYVLARPAEPWVDVEPAVAGKLLRWSLQPHATSAPYDLFASTDRRLEHLCGRLSNVCAPGQVDGIIDLVSAELHADTVVFSRWLREEGVVETLNAQRWVPTGERYDLSEYPMTRTALASHVAVQVLASDPSSDPAEVALMRESGYASLLMVPVIARGEGFGLLEAFSRNERPWTRSEINRARIIAYQLGSVLESLFGSEGWPVRPAEEAPAAVAFTRPGTSRLSR